VVGKDEETMALATVASPKSHRQRGGSSAPSDRARVIPGFKAKLSTHSMCAQESSLHTYVIEEDIEFPKVLSAKQRPEKTES
jgi:hypothetical protein